MTSRASAQSTGPLVLGGRGFIGAQIVRALVRRGERPHLYGPIMRDNGITGDKTNAGRLDDLAGAFDETVGSIEDAEQLAAALAASSATRVISTAAFSAGRLGLMRSGERHRAQALAVNVGGFNTLLEQAQRAGVRRLVWTSSTTVYGYANNYPRNYSRPPVDEDAAPRPQTFYGLTKTLAEQLALYHRDRGGGEMNIVALRLPLVLGRGLWYQGAAAALAQMLEAAAPGAAHELCFHNAPLDLMDARDAARAVLAALDAQETLAAVYNVNGFTASAAELASAAERAMPGYRVTLVAPDQAPPLFPLISDARFRAALGFAPAYGPDALAIDLANHRSLDP